MEDRSAMRLHPIVILGVILVGLAARPALAQTSVLVTDPIFVFASAGDPLEQAGPSLLETFTQALDEATNCPVSSKNDLRAVASFERMRQMLGTDGGAQVAEELAGALGADTLVAWSIGALGDIYVVNARAIRGGSMVSSSTQRATSRAGVIAAVRAAGGETGRPLHCVTPGVDSIVYEVRVEYSEHDVNDVRATTMTGHTRRTDSFEIRNIFSTKNHMDLVETMHSSIIQKPALGQCRGPGGYRMMPSKVDHDTQSKATASADSDGSIEFSVEGGMLRITGSGVNSFEATTTTTQKSSGINCGEASEPTSQTDTSTAQSVQLSGANFDIQVPIDRTQAAQKGSKSWPFEQNGWKGTATLTWNLKSVPRF